MDNGIGIRTAQLLDEVDHALVGHPRSEWSAELEDLYQKALEQMGIMDEIDSTGAECSKGECVYEAPLNRVKEGLACLR
jgi:hypothetical protein